MLTTWRAPGPDSPRQVKSPARSTALRSPAPLRSCRSRESEHRRRQDALAELVRLGACIACGPTRPGTPCRPPVPTTRATSRSIAARPASPHTVPAPAPVPVAIEAGGDCAFGFRQGRCLIFGAEEAVCCWAVAAIKATAAVINRIGRSLPTYCGDIVHHFLRPDTDSCQRILRVDRSPRAVLGFL